MMTTTTTIRCSFPTLEARSNMGIQGIQAMDIYATTIELIVPVTAATPPVMDREAMYAALFA